MIAAVIGALVLAAQAAGLAESAAPAPAATAPAKALQPKDASQKVVCKNETTVGSLIPKRICLTQEDWDAMRDAAKQVTRDIQTGALQRPSIEQSNAH